jgi:hypothetical protein
MFKPLIVAIIISAFLTVAFCSYKVGRVQGIAERQFTSIDFRDSFEVKTMHNYLWKYTFKNNQLIIEKIK